MLTVLGALGALFASLWLDVSPVQQADDSEDRSEDDQPANNRQWPDDTTDNEPSDDGLMQFLGLQPDAAMADEGAGDENAGMALSGDIPDLPDPDETLSGGAGGDILAGNGGNDQIDGGAGGDRLSGRDGQDSIFGDDGDDQLDGEGGDDWLWGDLGNDTLRGGDGDDWMDGGVGNDVMAGQSGNDRLDGQSGDDHLLGGDGDDSVLGGAGDDVVEGGIGNDILIGGAGQDQLEGGAGDDTLWGGHDQSDGASVDFLNGGTGRDLLALGSGDYGNGGQDADSFALVDYGPGQPPAVVTDFDAKEDELVVVFDPALHPEPVLSFQADGPDGQLSLDGVPIARLIGTTELDLGTIALKQG